MSKVYVLMTIRIICSFFHLFYSESQRQNSWSSCHKLWVIVPETQRNQVLSYFLSFSHPPWSPFAKTITTITCNWPNSFNFHCKGLKRLLGEKFSLDWKFWQLFFVSISLHLISLINSLEESSTPLIGKTELDLLQLTSCDYPVPETLTCVHVTKANESSSHNEGAGKLCNSQVSRLRPWVSRFLSFYRRLSLWPTALSFPLPDIFSLSVFLSPSLMPTLHYFPSSCQMSNNNSKLSSSRQTSFIEPYVIVSLSVLNQYSLSHYHFEHSLAIRSNLTHINGFNFTNCMIMYYIYSICTYHNQIFPVAD